MSSKRTVAVIDMGSLSVRLKIYQLVRKEIPCEIESLRRFFAIGAETYRYGEISEDRVIELCEILSGFVIKMKEYKIQESICVATSAYREAKNRDFVMEQIRLKTGLEVVILDNSQERYCHTLAVKEMMESFEQIIKTGTMILDIGAGSIQTTVYDKSEFVFSQNMLLGSLRVSELLSDLEKQTPHYREVLEEFISHDLDDYHAVEPKGIDYKSMIAFGSDIGFIKVLAGFSPREYCFMTARKFYEVFDYLTKTQPSELVMKRNISASTATLLYPTALIIKKMIESTGLDGIHMPAASLCDGLIFQYAYDHFGYLPKSDPFRDSISAARHIGRRYRYDRKHTEQVERFALAIFDATRKIHSLGERERLLLQLTVILHEIGKYISVSNHNTRTYHIIQTSEIIGIDARERELIACAARFYTESDIQADKYFQYLSKEQRLIVSKLSAILRVADSLDASHKQKIKTISVLPQKDALVVICDALHDLTYEKWAFDTKTGLFRQVFGMEPVLKPRRQTS